jgi:hypothetical protein
LPFSPKIARRQKADDLMSASELEERAVWAGIVKQKGWSSLCHAPPVRLDLRSFAASVGRDLEYPC